MNICSLGLFVCVLFTVSSAVKRKIHLKFLIPWKSGPLRIGARIGSAISVGLDRVKAQNILPEYDIIWDLTDTECHPLSALRGIVDSWNSTESGIVIPIGALIGGGCSVVCEPIARLSAFRNIAFVSFGCTSDGLSNRRQYWTFTRTIGSWHNLCVVFNLMAEKFRWKRIAVFYTSQPVMQSTATELCRLLKANGKLAFPREMAETMVGSTLNQDSYRNLKAAMLKLTDKANAFILLMHDIEVLNFLLGAKEVGLYSSSANYMFVAINPIFYRDLKAIPHLNRLGKDEVSNAYKRLMSVHIRRPSGEEWQDFAQQVVNHFNDQMYRDFPKVESAQEVDVHAGLLHDAILLWANGVRKTLDEGGSALDGARVTENMLKSKFTGVTGLVEFGSDGNRFLDYTISIVRDDKFFPIMRYHAQQEQLHWTATEFTLEDLLRQNVKLSCEEGGPGCPPVLSETSIGIIVGVIVVVVASIVVGSAVLIRRSKRQRELKVLDMFVIPWNNVRDPNVIREDKDARIQMTFSGTEILHSSPTSDMVQHLASLTSSALLCSNIILYKDQWWLMKKVNRKNVDLEERWVVLEINQMKAVEHANLTQFAGICIDTDSFYIVMSYCNRGNLRDLISNSRTKLDRTFRIAFITDINRGLCYLHGSSLVSHGHLSSFNCVVDAKWTCKITDYGLPRLRTLADVDDDFAASLEALWMAPELLRQTPSLRHFAGTQEADIYAFGLIVFEVTYRKPIYHQHLRFTELSADDILKRICTVENPPFRPSTEARDRVVEVQTMDQLMVKCWHEDPAQRPDSTKVKAMLKDIVGGQFIDPVTSSLLLLSTHAEHLETLVMKQTEELYHEKKEIEKRLFSMLPKSVAKQLVKGNRAEAEKYDSITIFFSDIVGLHKLISESTPLEIMQLLNEVYTLFDNVTDGYDVYKVESIGDEYMMVSGLPIRNGIRHAAVIATMALHLLSSICNFQIPHLPGKQLQLRCGIHSGPVMAGVVGQKTPSYNMFGDTVNTASRVRTRSTALRIQASVQTVRLLKELEISGSDVFRMELRGDIIAKGKGTLTTYWILGKEGFDLPLPDLSLAAPLEEHDFK